MAEFMIRMLCNASLHVCGADVRRLDRARGTHEALRPYNSASAIAARLKLPDDDERRQVVRALLELYQKRPSGLWSTLIVRAYEDLLVSIRAEVYLGLLQHEDIDQQIVMLALKHLRRYRLDRVGDCIAFSLGRDVRRDLHRSLRVERLEVQWLAKGATEKKDESDELAGKERLEARVLWTRIAEGHDEGGVAEQLLLNQEASFHSHIVEVTPGSDDEREREYHRARKALHRFSQRAREILDAEPGQVPTAALRRRLERYASRRQTPAPRASSEDQVGSPPTSSPGTPREPRPAARAP